MQYTIDFSLDGFDEAGESHRLVACVFSASPLAAYSPLREVAERLVSFSARILNVRKESLALRCIKIKSIWLINGSGKRTRVSGKSLLESLIKTGDVAARGRHEGRIEAKPKPLRRHIRRH